MPDIVHQSDLLNAPRLLPNPGTSQVEGLYEKRLQYPLKAPYLAQDRQELEEWVWIQMRSGTLCEALKRLVHACALCGPYLSQ